MIKSAVVTETQKGVPASIDFSMKATAITVTVTCHTLNTYSTLVRERLQGVAPALAKT